MTMGLHEVMNLWRIAFIAANKTLKAHLSHLLTKLWLYSRLFDVLK